MKRNAELETRNDERKNASVVPRSSFGASPRRAFTLLEVLLALAILVGSLAVVGELADQGLNSARHAAALAEAQLLCESKLAEFTSGITPPTSVQALPLDVEGAWLYTVVVEPTADQTLVTVRVTVTENLPPEKRPTEFTLVRRLPSSTAAGDETSTSSDGASETGS